MNTLDPLVAFPATQYYFDTFIVGAHHSLPHLVADLLERKSIAEFWVEKDIPNCKKESLVHILAMIDKKLSTIDADEEYKLEAAEPMYWIHRLSKQSALEISTYGRIRPETMELLMCLEDDEFAYIMCLAGRLSTKIQAIGDNSLSSHQAPLPSSIPII